MTSHDDVEQYELPGYKALFNSVGNGKGLASYSKVNPIYQEFVTRGNFQIIKLEMEEVSIFIIVFKMISLSNYKFYVSVCEH